MLKTELAGGSRDDRGDSTPPPKPGVKIKLNVRGVCCLKPGVKGVSENIRVAEHHRPPTLEHARIFCFRQGGTPVVSIASADFMDRNLSKRVELLIPSRRRCRAQAADQHAGELLHRQCASPHAGAGWPRPAARPAIPPSRCAPRKPSPATPPSAPSSTCKRPTPWCRICRRREGRALHASRRSLASLRPDLLRFVARQTSLVFAVELERMK